MRLILSLGILTALGASSANARVDDVIDIAPYLGARNDYYIDNFYTIDQGRMDEAIAVYGYYYRRVYAYLPKEANPYLHPQLKPNARYWKGAPQYEHVYTHLADERAYIESIGWIYERDEGAIFDGPFQGLAPMYRLSKFDGYTGDLQHYYTVDGYEVGQMQAQDFLFEGIRGYVFAPKSPNAYPTAGVFGSNLHVVVPGVVDINSPTPTIAASNGCGGDVSVSLDGRYLGSFRPSFGPVPGTFNTNGCVVKTNTYVAYGSHSVTIKHTGVAGRVNGNNGHAAYNFWTYVPPTEITRTVWR